MAKHVTEARLYKYLARAIKLIICNFCFDSHVENRKKLHRIWQDVCACCKSNYYIGFYTRPVGSNLCTSNFFLLNFVDKLQKITSKLSRMEFFFWYDITCWVFLKIDFKNDFEKIYCLTKLGIDLLTNMGPRNIVRVFYIEIK